MGMTFEFQQTEPNKLIRTSVEVEPTQQIKQNKLWPTPQSEKEILCDKQPELN